MHHRGKNASIDTKIFDLRFMAEKHFVIFQKCLRYLHGVDLGVFEIKHDHLQETQIKAAASNSLIH